MVDSYIAVSEKVKEHAISHSKIHPDKIVTIYNGVRSIDNRINADPAAIRKTLNLSPSDRVVMVIGRLRREKGHAYLIDAIDDVRKKIPDIELIIVGEGEEEKRLKDKAKKLSLTDTVHFTGVREDVPALLALAELVVLPSLWEGMPNCLLEAMNAGKPIVATRVGGIPEVVIDGDTGILVPPRDSKALKEAIIKILSRREEAQEMGMRGKKRVVQCFPLEKSIHATETIYQESLSKRARLC
jgi:glycosyltransferase involved in cell wall biosynthesis